MAEGCTAGPGPRPMRTPARGGDAAPPSEPPPCAPHDKSPCQKRESHILLASNRVCDADRPGVEHGGHVPSCRAGSFMHVAELHRPLRS